MTGSFQPKLEDIKALKDCFFPGENDEKRCEPKRRAAKVFFTLWKSWAGILLFLLLVPVAQGLAAPKPDIRPVFQDNRIHYALNCASIGCPQLQPVPFTAENMDTLLNRARREFINSPHGVRIGNGRLTVSSIYTWFKQDFGDGDQEVIAHLRTFADQELDWQLQKFNSIDKYQYDWALNRSR